MRLIIITIFLIVIGPRVLSCDCKFRDIKTELNLSNEILLGQLISINKGYFKIKVLKTWKGKLKVDSLSINYGDGCYQKILYPENEYFLIYLEQSGIHMYSRTIQYTKSKDVKLLDSLFKTTLWTNEKESETLEKLDYTRQYIIQTNKGSIDIKGKKVLYNFEGKVVSRENIPADLNDFYPIRYFVVATKDSIFDNSCNIDYIIYINQVHQDYLELPERMRRRIEKKSINPACR